MCCTSGWRPKHQSGQLSGSESGPSIDIQYAHLHVPIVRAMQKYVRFRMNGRVKQFYMLSLQFSNFAQVVTPIRSGTAAQRIQTACVLGWLAHQSIVSHTGLQHVYLDDWLIRALSPTQACSMCTWMTGSSEHCLPHWPAACVLGWLAHQSIVSHTGLQHVYLDDWLIRALSPTQVCSMCTWMTGSSEHCLPHRPAACVLGWLAHQSIVSHTGLQHVYLDDWLIRALSSTQVYSMCTWMTRSSEHCLPHRSTAYVLLIGTISVNPGIDWPITSLMADVENHLHSVIGYSEMQTVPVDTQRGLVSSCWLWRYLEHDRHQSTSGGWIPGQESNSVASSFVHWGPGYLSLLNLDGQ